MGIGFVVRGGGVRNRQRLGGGIFLVVVVAEVWVIGGAVGTGGGVAASGRAVTLRGGVGRFCLRLILRGLLGGGLFGGGV